MEDNYFNLNKQLFTQLVQNALDSHIAGGSQGNKLREDVLWITSVLYLYSEEASKRWEEKRKQKAR